MVLVDTSVLLDVLLDDPQFASASEAALRDVRRTEGLVLCETVLAELGPVFSTDEKLEDFVEDIGLEYRPCPKSAAMLAGRMYAEYLAHRGTAKRVVPDFLIGAQAVVSGYSLLARDRGYYREYFRDLNVLVPTETEKPWTNNQSDPSPPS